MTKRILALLLAALCLLLAACGKQETAAETDGNGLGEKAEFVKEDYVGSWKYNDYDLYLTVYSDGTWEETDGTGSVTASGTSTFSELDGLSLYNQGSFVRSFQLTDAKSMTDSDGGSLSAAQMPEYVPEYSESDFYGNWEYDDSTKFLTLDESKQWKAVLSSGKVEATGRFEYQDGVAYLYEITPPEDEDDEEEKDLYTMVYFDSEGNLTDNGVHTMHSSDENPQSYIDLNGIEANYTLDDDPVMLKNGGYVYSEADGYHQMPVRVEIEEKRTRHRSGLLKLKVRVTVDYLIDDDVSTVDDDPERGFSYGLFNAYTGQHYIIGEPNRKGYAENSWQMAWNGSNTTVYAEVDMTWSNKTRSDRNARCTADIYIEVPEDFDGLMLYLCPTESTYEAQKTPVDTSVPVTDSLGARLNSAVICKLFMED